MANFTVSKEKRGDQDVLKFAGRLDEEAGLALIRLYADAGKRVVFNFHGVTSINSNGTRAWVLFLRDFQIDRAIEVEECTPAVVEQMNMLPSFLQKARVRSVFAIFDCTACHAHQDVLVEERDFAKAKAGQLPGGRCKGCGAALTYVDEGEAFAFVKDVA